MNEVGFRDQLITVLARRDLKSETIAIAADVIAADARFNWAIARKKRSGEDIDLIQWSEFYESLVESCMTELRHFGIGEDEGRLASSLRATRDKLTETIVTLGGHAD